MLYPLTISFGVVYLGEHYIADAVIGLALGLCCYLLVEAPEHLRTIWKGRPLPVPVPTEVVPCVECG